MWTKSGWAPDRAVRTSYGGCEVLIEHGDIMVKAPDGDLAFFGSMASVRRWVKGKRKAMLAVAAAALILVSSAGASSRPPHYAMWLCVHQHEHTAWHDPNAPYLGGLQMGTDWFVPHYMAILPHPPGLPNTWSPLQQMWFAERAYRHEHYSHEWLYGQWPPSRGACF